MKRFGEAAGELDRLATLIGQKTGAEVICWDDFSKETTICTNWLIKGGD